MNSERWLVCNQDLTRYLEDSGRIKINLPHEDVVHILEYCVTRLSDPIIGEDFGDYEQDIWVDSESDNYLNRLPGSE